MPPDTPGAKYFQKFLSGVKKAISSEKSGSIQKGLLKVLHSMALRVEHVPESLLPSFLSSVADCHSVLRNSVTDAMMRDILLRLVNKKYFNHLLPLAQHLSSALQNSGEGNKISLSCYAALWNAVIKVHSPPIDPFMTLTVRLAALSFHIQCQPFSKFAEKLRISLQVFSDELKKHPSREVNIDVLSSFMKDVVNNYFQQHLEVLELYVGLTLCYLRVAILVLNDPKTTILQVCDRDVGSFNVIYQGLTEIVQDSEDVNFTSVEELITESPSILKDFCDIALKISKDWKTLHHLDLINMQIIHPDADEKSMYQYVAVILRSLDRTLDCLKSQADLKEEEIKMLLDNARDVSEKFEHVIEGDRKKGDLLLKLANLSYKIGRWGYQQKLFSDALPFFTVAFESFSKVKEAAGNAEKSFEALVDCQRRSERYQDAMATVIDGLHGNEQLLTSLARTWVQLKMKCSEDDPTLSRTLAECYLEKYPKTTLSKEDMLTVELDEWTTAG
ncbi:hypothetical protein CAPTEDRAFT_188263 [Capitella teleta]|uniref:Uncharacterized protein n=1 Tax=Capitella teleta TaxID=283909 RepID=R7TEG6_CAPTE|nr:hypothetical protein CAPTEDRAFT_188263 [Capitella teleta]|eukprot:ELT91867.1 hypothetical protein CAPTEDRAFT_188263 [Capitella teleta]